jgi:hypothetical protein
VGYILVINCWELGSLELGREMGGYTKVFRGLKFKIPFVSALDDESSPRSFKHFTHANLPSPLNAHWLFLRSN